MCQTFVPGVIIRVRKDEKGLNSEGIMQKKEKEIKGTTDMNEKEDQELKACLSVLITCKKVDTS